MKHICNTLLASSREASLSSFRRILKRKRVEKDFDEQSEVYRNYIKEFKVTFSFRLRCSSFEETFLRYIKRVAKCLRSIPDDN